MERKAFAPIKIDILLLEESILTNSPDGQFEVDPTGNDLMWE